ncbi:MAG: hypothetical protein NUV58_00565, partial [Candidatus Roizmanbacteria bacterium]|nr:hypothetical protein [Candidatus Roizmanbacteria bacterium]
RSFPVSKTRPFILFRLGVRTYNAYKSLKFFYVREGWDNFRTVNWLDIIEDTEIYYQQLQLSIKELNS